MMPKHLLMLWAAFAVVATLVSLPLAAGRLPRVDSPKADIAAPLDAVQQQQDPEPPKLPAGEYCAHIAHDQGPAHACACHRTCYMDDSDPPQQHMQEDSHCQVFCKPQFCRCPIEDNCEAPKR